MALRLQNNPDPRLTALGGLQVVQGFDQMGSQLAAQARNEQIRQALSGVTQPQQIPQTQQTQQLAEQSLGLGGEQAQAEQQQTVMTLDEMKQQALSIDPALAKQQFKLLGIDSASKRAEASREAARIQGLPFNLREQAINERIQNVLARGGNPKDSMELLDMNEGEQNQALSAIQMMDLSTKDRFAVQDRQRARGQKIGTFNPRDYTVESFAEFRKTGDPSKLKRFTDKTLTIGGVGYKLDTDTGEYNPIRDVNVVASDKALINAIVKTKEAEAKERGEVLTDLARAEATLPQLKVVVNKLKDLSKVATSTFGGRAFDVVIKETGFGSTKGATARAKFIAIVNNQVLPLLKPTFGAAFTVQEGESLKATMGDPNASPEQKMSQLDAFIEQKIRDIESKESQLNTKENEGQVIKFDAQGNIL